MKISVSTYSYSKLMAKNEITQLGCIAKAKEQGFDAVEIVGIIPHDGSSELEYAEKIGAEAKRLDIPISNFTVGADFLLDTKKEIERVKQMVDFAEIIGTKSIRHDATSGFEKGTRKYRGFDDALPILADACREVTEYAKTKGIKTMVENHGYFCQDSDRVEKLVNTVAHENFGLLVDIGNFVCADERPEIAVGRVAPYAFYAHAKDFHIKSAQMQNPGAGFFRSRNGTYLRGAIIGHGDVPVTNCIATLKRADYDGYIAIEFEGMEDTLEGIAIGLENLRRYIAIS